jgi:nitroreductase
MIPNWPLSSVIAPSYDEDSETAKIFLGSDNKRFAISASYLASQIKAGSIKLPARSRSRIEAADDSLSRAWPTWRSHNWLPAIDLYLSSRNLHTIDRTNHRLAHAVAVREYELAKEIPAINPPENSLLVNLSTPQQPTSDTTIGYQACRRRTIRVFAKTPFNQPGFSGWLWYGFLDVRGARLQTSPDRASSYFTSYGSAFEYYIVVYDIVGLVPGIYWYNPESNKFYIVKTGNYRRQMRRLLFGQHAVLSANWTMILGTDFKQTQWRYRHDRALRILYTDSGIVVNNLIALGESYDLGSLPTPATMDKDLCVLFDRTPLEWAPIYTLTVGVKRPLG